MSHLLRQFGGYEAGGVSRYIQSNRRGVVLEWEGSVSCLWRMGTFRVRGRDDDMEGGMET